MTIAAAIPGRKLRDIGRVYDEIGVTDAKKKRDAAISRAAEAFNSAIHKALKKREGRLSAIAKSTDRKQKRLASKQAWAEYRQTKAEAIQTHQEAKLSAWSRYRADKQSCLMEALPDALEASAA